MKTIDKLELEIKILKTMQSLQEDLSKIFEDKKSYIDDFKEFKEVEVDKQDRTLNAHIEINNLEDRVYYNEEYNLLQVKGFTSSNFIRIIDFLDKLNRGI